MVLTSDYCWPAGDQESVGAFLTQIVPQASARLQISKGIVAEIPTPTQQYVQTRPPVPVLQFKNRVLQQLRTTAAFGILFSHTATEEPDEAKEFRRTLANIVKQFGEDPHWENFYSRAISSHLDDNYADAIVMYEKARQSIQGDPNVCNEECWQQQVRIIERLQERAQRGCPLRVEELDRNYSGS
jgi:hypothetical protein